MVGSGLSAQEAYEAVPQLADRGEKVLQNLRKRAREARALLEARAAPPKPAKPRAKKQKKPLAVLPKGKRLRTDQVDAISAQKVQKRQRRSDAHKEATSELAQVQVQSHTVVGAYVVVNFVICEHTFSMSATNSSTLRLKSSTRAAV
jgi:uncharacterized protein with GYD domain